MDDRDLRQGWIDAKTAQSARAELKAMLKSIENRKVAIQLAAQF